MELTGGQGLTCQFYTSTRLARCMGGSKRGRIISRNCSHFRMSYLLLYEQNERPVWFHTVLGLFLNGRSDRKLNDEQTDYEQVLSDISPVIRRTPLMGSTETVTVPSSI